MRELGFDRNTMILVTPTYAFEVDNSAGYAAVPVME